MLRCQFCGAELESQCEHPDTLTCIRALQERLAMAEAHVAALEAERADGARRLRGLVAGQYVQVDTFELLREAG